MSTQKRAPASASSGQPSQPKRQCFGSANEAVDASENILTPKTFLTLEDLQRVMDSAVQRIESGIANSLNENCKCLLEELVKRVEALEHAQVHCTCLGRAYATSGEMNDVRNLQLQVRTKLSLPVYTGRKLEGENSRAISVALIDANTGEVISSGPESCIKLLVFVLDGDFNKDDNNDWTPEEFENNVVKGRERRGPLLIGNCRVVLKEGVGVLGDLKFNDNSSWIPSQKFRIGLKVASGYCENARIREAITEAFRVKEHRGESSEKKHPPAPDDELWRLKKIAKDGKPLQRLNNAGIHKVEDFLLKLFKDPENLKDILGMTEKNWTILMDHAKTCTPSGKLDVFSQGDTKNHGVVLKNASQLSGLIENGAYFATHRLSTSQEEYEDSMLKKASDNLNGVEEFHGKVSLVSIEDKHSNSFPSGVIGGQTGSLNLVEQNPTAVCVNAVGGEVPHPFVQSTSEGHEGITAVHLPTQSQNTSLQGLPEQLQNISFQTALQFAGPAYWSPSSFSAICVNSPTEGHFLMDNYTEESFSDIWIRTPPYDSNSGKASGKAIVGWLKIKAALQWGIFGRRALRIIELEEGQN